MIVMNEEEHLRDCLLSVRDIVDQIVVVDTGSTDGTIQIANEFNAEVYHFEWINDFSAARNFALRKSTCDWILYLDADERFSSKSKIELKSISRTNELLGVNCFVKSPDTETGRENVIRYPRLFRNSDKIRFSGSVHEQIIESLQVNEYKVVNSSIEIIHLGYDVSKEKKKEKALRNLALLKKDHEKEPTLYTTFQLAQTYNVLEQYEESTLIFKEVACNKTAGKKFRLLSYYNIAVAELRSHDLDASLKNTIAGLKIDDEFPPLNYLLSKICLRNGDINQAIKLCQKTYRKNSLILKNNSFMNNDIVLNNEELILCGLNLSRNAGYNESLTYYLNEYSQPQEKNFIVNGASKSLIINKILQKNKIDEQEINILEDIATPGNIEYLVSIISVYNFDQIKSQILERLTLKFPEDCIISSAYALSLLEEGKEDQSIRLLEKLLDHPDVQPSVPFYLISIYTGSGRFEEITRLINFSESKFDSIPEAKAAIEMIKQKLKGLMLEV